jgi:hypothetical protein
MMSRTTLTLLSVLGGALLLTACDSATAPVSSLRPTGSASADKGSGDDKDACKKGGFADYTRADGSTFKNQGDCVSYVEHGGQLVSKTLPLPVIASFTFDALVNHCAEGLGYDMLRLTATFNGGTGTSTGPWGGVTPVISGVQVTLPARDGAYTLTVTNAAGSATASLDPLGGGTPQCGAGSDFSRTPGGRGRIGGG